jgi:Spy/CpxP family protein refolding chaperone
MVTQGSEIRSRVWTVLTPEQRKKLPELEAQMRDKFRERMHDRFEHRDHAPSPAETPPT